MFNSCVLSVVLNLRVCVCVFVPRNLADDDARSEGNDRILS